MNEFPKFHPNQPALTQLSSAKLNLVSLGQKANQIQPGVGYRVTQTPGGTTVSPILSLIRSRTRTPPHPWKVTVSNDNISVNWGAVTVHGWYLDSGGIIYPETLELVTTIGGAGLAGNPLEAEEGTITLGETCGVWLKVTWGTGFEYGVPYFASGIGDTESYFSYPSESVIITDTTNTEYDDGPTLSAASQPYTFHYIGKITVTAGVASIVQWRKSDLMLQGQIVSQAVGG